MYDFGGRQAEITGMSICFEDDGGGVIVPTDITVEYATGGENWQPVNRKGNWTITEEEKTYEFDPVTVSKIRVTMTHGTIDGQKIGVAVRDWKLLGEIPADFPRPVVVPPEEPSPDLQLPDVAIYAVPSTDKIADWDRLEGINDPTFEPAASSDTRIDGDGNGLGWGNWPATPGDEHWLQYDWGAPLTTKTFQVYWHGSDLGMKIPSKVRFTYMDVNGDWQEAKIISDKRITPNITRITRLRLNRLRQNQFV